MFDATTISGAGNSADRRQIFECEALPHLDALYAAALRLTRNDDESRDLIQETMLRALRFFHRFTPGTDCRAQRARVQRLFQHIMAGARSPCRRLRRRPARNIANG